jgi:hypothetical protein
MEHINIDEKSFPEENFTAAGTFPYCVVSRLQGFLKNRNGPLGKRAGEGDENPWSLL